MCVCVWLNVPTLKDGVAKDGAILLFLPGVREILAVIEALQADSVLGQQRFVRLFFRSYLRGGLCVFVCV